MGPRVATSYSLKVDSDNGSKSGGLRLDHKKNTWTTSGDAILVDFTGTWVQVVNTIILTGSRQKAKMEPINSNLDPIGQSGYVKGDLVARGETPAFLLLAEETE
jgi:hypothetical protein